MQSQFLKFMSNQENLAEQRRKDELAQQQLAFQNSLAMSKEARAQSEYQRKVNQRNAVNQLSKTWSPNLGNGAGLETQQNSIAEYFNTANKKAEEELAKNGVTQRLNQYKDANGVERTELTPTEKQDLDMLYKTVGNTYDKYAYENSPYAGKTSSGNAALQSIFDNNTMTKQQAHADVMHRAAANGIDVSTAKALADTLTATLVDQKVQDATAAKAMNKRLENAAKIKFEADKANQTIAAKPTKSTGSSGSGSGYSVKKALSDKAYPKLIEEVKTGGEFTGVITGSSFLDLKADDITKKLTAMQNAGVPSALAESLLKGNTENTIDFWGLGVNKEVDPKFSTLADAAIKDAKDGKFTSTKSSKDNGAKHLKLVAEDYIPKTVTAYDIKAQRQKKLSQEADTELARILGLSTKNSITPTTKTGTAKIPENKKTEKKPDTNALLTALNSPKKGEVARVTTANANDLDKLKATVKGLSDRDKKRLEKVINSSSTQDLFAKLLNTGKVHSGIVPSTSITKIGSTTRKVDKVYGKAGNILPISNTNPRARRSVNYKTTTDILKEILKNKSKPSTHLSGTPRNR